MPLFTYECSECGNIFEALELNNKKTETCPKCNSKKIDKYIGHSSFILKGFGWAKHGYASAPSTPIDSDGPAVVSRFPEYSDRNTGKKLGLGLPETKVF